jgi:MFS family permease
MNAGTRHYATVTAAYWGFTLTDGALRMLVLLHFYKLGYSPFTLAFLFLLYEAAGILANLIGGWLATRYGIARMLAVGLATQIFGFLLLSACCHLNGARPCRSPGSSSLKVCVALQKI